jgi:hypothetical protein
VPYLAWAGEEIRLEKCFVAPGISSASDLGSGVARAEFLVEDWSGTAQPPQVEDPTVKLYYSASRGEVCAQGDVVSLFPGMARVELDVVDNAGVLGLPGSGSAVPVLKHQFLAGWMTLNTPTLRELGATDFASTAQAEAARELGDPSGNGEFNAGGGSGYLSVKVTGSMPMSGAWSGLVGASSVTLPTDWVKLAHALATDDNPADTTPWNKWDTSGDSTGYEGHVPQTPPCAAEPPQFAGVTVEPTTPDSYTSVLDNGDNCTGGGPDGPFSTVFGTLSGDGTTIGPFDPLFPGDTLLSDGNLSSQDAPMPAARIDVSIAPNTGSATDISGVGSLVAANKTKTYSRDFLGDDVAHNLYAPFYDAYIPATSRPGDSSGVDGAAANNFPGFLTSGLYHFWDTFSLASNAPTATNCLRLSAGHDPQADSPAAHPGDYYQTPSGDSTVAVYTDQNGEAQVQYVPGTGFYFNNLGGAVLNADGGCDLQALYNVPDSLGTASITATARYPFKPVDFPALTSAPVTKSVTSLWSKTLAYFPKGPGAANANSRIVVAHAQDITGAPFAGEVVCFSSDAEGMTWFDGTVGPYNLSGTSSASDPKGASLGRICVRTDSNGNAAVEVLESNPVNVNVIADFTDEGILRSITAAFGTVGSSGGTPPPTPTTGGTPTSGTTTTSSTSANSGTTAPSAATIAQVAPALGATKATVKANAARIMIVRLVSRPGKAPYVVIKVSSSSKTAKVRLRLLTGRRHHKLTSHTRVVTVRTNRQVTITVSKSVLKLGVASLIK